MVGSKRAARAFCDDCKSKAIGPRAYHERYAMQQPWVQIAARIGSKNAASCERQARRYAASKDLPWPVPRLTMQDVPCRAPARLA
ncbi:MAG: hypothetical protein OXE76_05525 [Alphaproteobacteria bacterium]|nr:hypothetical protein [Alphaproteobacteria bacterium]